MTLIHTPYVDRNPKPPYSDPNRTGCLWGRGLLPLRLEFLPGRGRGGGVGLARLSLLDRLQWADCGPHEGPMDYSTDARPGSWALLFLFINFAQ